MTTNDLYLTKVRLHAELDRCMNCRMQPCMNACPVNCNPGEFIQHAKSGRWKDAVNTIMRTNPMGQTCGLICPDKFCMKSCTRGKIDFPINIPKVQATILENYRTPDAVERKAPQINKKKIAIIGAGPAGLAAAARLGQAGFEVDVFEKRHEIGGALNMIPDARLPHEVIEKDWRYICTGENISLHLDSCIRDPRILLEKFDGVIVATGEPNCIALHIPGEELSVSYMDYLYQPEKYITSGHVAIIGGGNVAVDCALTAERQGAVSVEMFIRRRISDMRISRHEYEVLLEHHINLNGMMSPERIENNGTHQTLFVRRNILNGEKWEPLPDSTIALPYFDLVVRAIGSRADEKIENEPRIVYAGDCKIGGSTIVEAIASGRTAAEVFL